MKKIGVVTLYGNNNYGSLLQCFSTQIILSQIGYKGVLIKRSEKTAARLLVKIGRYIQFFVRSLLYPQKLKNFLAVQKKSHIAYNSCSEKTKKLISKFASEFICEEVFSYRELKRIARTSEYCAFISGSDQIWNITGPYRDPIFFLRFAPREKRIAFAPSFGVSEIPTYDKYELSKYIKEYCCLSVREQRGAELIRELTGRNAKVIVDPTLQLDGKYWREVSSSHLIVPKNKSKYILLYFLNPPSSIAIDTINYISKLTSYDILVMPYDYKEYQQLNDYKIIEGGPFDYVYLIDNAEFVCTDSFHGTVFSINLNTPFLSFDRQYGHAFNQSSRLKSVLNIFKLKNRFITNSIDLNPDLLSIDFTEANSILNEERDRARNYLINSIKEVTIKQDRGHI